MDGKGAGFATLDVQSGGDVELAYFGLLGEFIGRGCGGASLAEAVHRAWALGARHVWLHTCTLDHPSVLPGYRARGFRVYKWSRRGRASDAARTSNSQRPSVW